MMRNLIFNTAWILFWSVSCPAAATRVAVLPAPGLDDAETVLMAALSALPDLEVMERAQVKSLAQEKNLQTLAADPEGSRKVGQLLGVDALIVLERSEAERMVSTRLIAVGPGVVSDVQSTTWPIGDPAGWAQFISRRFGASLKRLPKESGAKILLGVLGIRSSTTGQIAAQLERECSILVSRALVRLPGVFVLDRSQMRELDWEKQLQSTAVSDYWSSAWLVDGNVTPDGKRLIFDGQLQPAAGGAAKPVRVEAASAAELGEAVAGAVAQNLQTLPAIPVSDPTPEALQFQAEAEWAFRWKQFDQAERAADASWTLGNRKEALAMIRAKSPATAAVTKIRRVTVNEVFSREQPPDALDPMIRAFSNLRQFRGTHPNWTPSASSVGSMTDILLAASQVLQAFYYLPRDRTTEEQDLLQWLRGELRDCLPLMAGSAKSSLLSLEPYEIDNLVESADKPPVTFFAAYGLYGPLWSETPEASAQALIQALDAVEGLAPALSAALKKRILCERENHHPLTVAWNHGDRSRVSPVREGLLQQMLAQGPARKLDALILNLWRYGHFGMPELQKKIPPPLIQKTVSDFENGLWAMREHIRDGTLPSQLVSAALQLHFQVTDVVTYKRHLQPASELFKKQLCQFLLERQWAGPQEIYGILTTGVHYTLEERDGMLRAIENFQNAGPKPPRYLARYKEQVSRATVEAIPLPVARSVVANALPPTRVFSVSTDGFPSVLSRNKKFLLRKQASSGVEITEMDPATGSQNTVFIPIGDISGTGGWEADESNFYFASPERLFRFNREAQKLETKALPQLGGGTVRLFMAGGKLHATSSEGTIVRIDPITLDAELLASARRRPAQTLLDDRKPFEVDKVFEQESWLVFVMGNEPWYYVWDEAARNFRKAAQSLAPSPNAVYNRRLILNWIGPDGESEQALHPCFFLLVDPGKTGRLPPLTTWPPKLKLNGDETFPSEVFNASAAGERLYILFGGGKNRETYLKIVDSAKDFCVPLQLPQGGRTLFYNKVAASEAGVLIYGRSAKELLFYSQTDLEGFAP